MPVNVVYYNKNVQKKRRIARESSTLGDANAGSEGPCSSTLLQVKPSLHTEPHCAEPPSNPLYQSNNLRASLCLSDALYRRRDSRESDESGPTPQKHDQRPSDLLAHLGKSSTCDCH